MSLHELSQIARLWQNEYPDRARGGSDALSGFHYQFLVVLLESVRSWLSLPKSRRAEPTVFSEILSDLVSPMSGDLLIVTQIKRTQSSGTVRSALSELFSIYCVVENNGTPALAERIHYRIMSSRSTLKEVSNTISNWLPKNQSEDQSEIIKFKEKVEAEILTSPRNELLTLLSIEFEAEDPLGDINQWLGRLISASEYNEFETASREIWNDFHRLEKSKDRKPPGVSVWSPLDRIPDVVNRGNCLTGRQPDIHHLRNGFFAFRKNVYAPLFEEALSWLEQDMAADEDEVLLPVFWIGGRSGCGKSVALLHLLAKFQEEGYDSILWLGNKVELLPDALRWSRRLQQDGKPPVIIGVDDPYVPGTEEESFSFWRSGLTQIEDLRQDGRFDSLPVVFCCGPTEQAEQFEDDFSEVSVRRYNLPSETSKDLKELRDWYRLRTGNEPPALGDENVLLVQLFFEWKTGEPLDQFAKNFNKRVRKLDPGGEVELSKLVSQVLAANRLYVDYSYIAIKKILTEEQYESLEMLIEDNHFTNPEEQDIGFRLSHPHLSNAIYRAEFHEGKRSAAQIEHLRQMVLDSYRYEEDNVSLKTAPLWAISRALVADTEQYRRLFPKKEKDASQRKSNSFDRRFKDFLKSIYENWMQEHLGTLPLSLLPVWIQIYAHHQKYSHQPRLELTPSPVSLALAKIQPENIRDKGFCLTCHKLLQFIDVWTRDDREAIEITILKLLEDAPSGHCRRAITSHAVAQISTDRVRPIALKWLRQNPFHHLWHFHWHKLLIATPDDNDLLRLGKSWLYRMSRQDGAWFHVWKDLLEDAVEKESLLKLGWRRLSTISEPSSKCWYGVQNRLLREALASTSSMELAIEWLEESSTEESAWCHVWIELLSKSSDKKELLARGRRWLDEVPPNHGRWGTIWQELLSVMSNDKEIELLNRGRKWLLDEASPDHGAWYIVWRELLSRFSDDEELLVRGQKWLLNCPNDYSLLLVALPIVRT